MKRWVFFLVIFLVILFLGGWLYINNQNNTSNTNPDQPRQGLGSLFPFLGGGSQTETPDPENPTAPDPENPTEGETNKLQRISERPVAGFYIFDSEEGRPTVRIAERGTGNIYDISLENEIHVSETSILRTAEAVFGKDGESVIIRYVKNDNQNVATYLAQIEEEEEGPGSLEGTFLPENIVSIGVSPNKTSFVYVSPLQEGSAGFSVTTDGSGTRQLFRSPFTEWLPQWTTEGVFMTSKPSSGVDGYLYKITSGLFIKQLGNIDGLTTLLHPTEDSILYGESADGLISLSVYINGESKKLGLATLPEKCTWSDEYLYCGSPTNIDRTLVYPDAWYQGQIQFNDTLWKIDTETGVLAELTNTPSLDITQVEIKNDYLFFVNKKDGRLWVFDLTED